jgi:hypothetical protein
VPPAPERRLSLRRVDRKIYGNPQQHSEAELRERRLLCVARTDRSRLGARDASATDDAEAGVGDAWVHLYSHARNASESLSAHLHHTRRLQGRMQGLAARSRVFTLQAAATNLHRIDRSMSDRAAGVQGPSKTPGKRVEDRTDYRRRYEASTVNGAQTRGKNEAASMQGRKGADVEAVVWARRLSPVPVDRVIVGAARCVRVRGRHTVA